MTHLALRGDSCQLWFSLKNYQLLDIMLKVQITNFLVQSLVGHFLWCICVLYKFIDYLYISSQLCYFVTCEKNFCKCDCFYNNSSNFQYSVVFRTYISISFIYLLCLRSFGVLLWEILEFGKLPYMSLSNNDVIQKVLIECSLKLEQPKTPCVHKDMM